MKKQAYSTPQMRVVRMRMSRSVLLGVSNVTTISSKSNNEDIGIEWDDTPDNSGVAY